MKSISPTEIVGAGQLWVFNTKTRKIGVYHAQDAGGLTMKGTTIQSFDESKSIQKKLRKPEKDLLNILQSGKVALRNFMSNVRAKESKLTGRLNADTILLRAVK